MRRYGWNTSYVPEKKFTLYPFSIIMLAGGDIYKYSWKDKLWLFTRTNLLRWLQDSKYHKQSQKRYNLLTYWTNLWRFLCDGNKRAERTGCTQDPYWLWTAICLRQHPTLEPNNSTLNLSPGNIWGCNLTATEQTQYIALSFSPADFCKMFW